MLNKSGGKRFGRLDDTAARILQVLEDDPDIEIQIQCQIGKLIKIAEKEKGRPKLTALCCL